MSITIEQLIIYPVKALRGISVNSATIYGTGLAGDREWMITDASGTFATQRKHPLMATIKTSLQDGIITLTNLDNDSITLEPPATDTLIDVSIWKDSFQALPASDDYNRWITESVKSSTPLQLVYFDKRNPRQINQHRFGSGQTFFADGAPFLVSNIESLKCLNQVLQTRGINTIEMDRFRANIVISGLRAFHEHNIESLQSEFKTTVIALKDHCQRCSVITVNQTTGIVSKPAHHFTALADLNPMPDIPKAPAFGVNSVLKKGNGNEINVGEVFLANSNS